MSKPGWAGDSNAHTAKWQEARTHAQPAPNTHSQRRTAHWAPRCRPLLLSGTRHPTRTPKRHSCSAPALKYRSPHRRWLSSLGSMGASYTCRG